MFSFLSRFRHLDLPLLAVMLILSAAGLAILYGTTLSDNSSDVFLRQLGFWVFGFLVFLFISFFDYHALAKTNRLVYVIMLALLLGLLLFGPTIRGGRRWLPLGFVSLQLAEFAKIIVILGLARLLYFRRGQINSWRTILWSFFYALFPAVLIVLEPDLGSSLVILSLWVGLVLLSPIKKRFLAILFLAFLVCVGMSWKFALKDFQKDRILVFLDPGIDPKGRGYNVRQATIAVGAGEIFGRGLGKGVQSQHKFLPERQTDFIFAAAGEEVGFVGSASLLLLYFFLLWRIISIMRRARDDLGMYIAGGVMSFFFFHVIVNIGMNIGLLPVTGIPLPFVSAGGSSLVANLIALGLVQNVSLQSKVLRF